MNLLEELVNEEKNELTKQLQGWVTYRKAGDYQAWNNYQPANDAWSAEEELKVITFLLKRLFNPLEDFMSPEEIQRQFIENKQIPISTRFFQIIHLLAVSDIVDELGTIINFEQDEFEEEIDLEEEDINQPLDFLKLLDIDVLVKSAIPGACLAYLGALKKSSEDNLTKIGEINSLILSLSSKKNQFGLLGHLILKIAVENYKELVVIESESNSILMNRLSGTIKDYQSKAGNCFSLDEVNKGLTFLDRCILKALNQLNNVIGQINLSGWESLINQNQCSLKNELDTSSPKELKNESQPKIQHGKKILNKFFLPENTYSPKTNLVRIFKEVFLKS